MKVLVILGTKAQYIKMAPILIQMDAIGLEYWLVYTGQHSETFDLLEKAFGARTADEVLIPNYEAATKTSFAKWTFSFWRKTLARIRSGAWRGMDVCLVHGDTASTLFGAVTARLAGVKVAHIEAGLRSSRLLDPFPEEIIRRLVSAMTHFHFPPDETAAANLNSVSGQVFQTYGNTLRDSLALSLRAISPAPTSGGNGGYGVVSIHRNENLSNASDFNLIMTAIEQASGTLPLKFVLHPATRAKLSTTPWNARLEAAPGVELMERMDYPEFVRLLVGSRLLMTDGGSNQEEAAMLGLPTLLLRRTTERPDGLGDNITLSHLRPDVIQDFVNQNSAQNWQVRQLNPASPSRLIIQTLAERIS